MMRLLCRLFCRKRKPQPEWPAVLYWHTRADDGTPLTEPIEHLTGIKYADLLRLFEADADLRKRVRALLGTR